jgi:hypothetical protein
MRRVVKGRNQIGILMIQMCVSFLGQNEDLQESENLIAYKIASRFFDLMNSETIQIALRFSAVEIF